MRKGFTLIETVTVIVLVGVLAAIGTTTFIGVLGRSEQLSATQTIDGARLTFQTHYDTRGFFPPTAAQIEAVLGAASVVGASTGPTGEELSIKVVGDVVTVAIRRAGTCWASTFGPTSQARTDEQYPAGTCSADEALSTVGSSW